MAPSRVRITDFAKMKRRGEKITMLTAYDATMARLLDRAGLDALLVGDSLGMVVLGHETTLPVTLDAMIHHTSAVSRGAKRALVIADMPFLTYQVTVSEAVAVWLQFPAKSRARTDTVWVPTARVVGIVPPIDPAASNNGFAFPAPGSAPIHHSPPARPESASDDVAVRFVG